MYEVPHIIHPGNTCTLTNIYIKSGPYATEDMTSCVRRLQRLPQSVPLGWCRAGTEDVVGCPKISHSAHTQHLFAVHARSFLPPVLKKKTRIQG